MTNADIQRALLARGFDLGKSGPNKDGVDGLIGDKTRTAIKAVQRAAGLAVTGMVDPATAALLATTRPAADARPAGIVPALWMPDAEIKGIVVHWTAGAHRASTLDREHYHVLIESDGKLVRGIPTIDLNGLPKARAGYAAHTLNCNTGFIGVSLCCMAGATEQPFNAGIAPMTREQWEKLPLVLADLCRRYSIPVTPKTVLSHAEVQGTLGIKQKGKIDIMWVPGMARMGSAVAIGDQFRAATAALLP